LPPSSQLSEKAREVVDVLQEELAEIASDLRFARSRRGKYVLFIQNYVQKLYETLRKDSRFDDVLIGAHSEREVVFVTGQVRGEANLRTLKSILLDSACGLPVEYLVKVNEGEGADSSFSTSLPSSPSTSSR
jgi:hypothetical protein